MVQPRRDFLRSALLAGAVAAQSKLKAAGQKTGMPGPFPGRVIAVQNPGCIVDDRYQSAAIESMMHKGMRELTGAPGWPDAWRALFEPGDVVGIKVSPVGGPKLCSDATVVHQILDGLQQAGVKPRDVIVFNRYRQEITGTGIDKWLPKDVRWTGASEKYDEFQLDMDGYDRDHFMEMALIKPGDNVNDAHFRRSYVAKVVTQQMNKIHQSAGAEASPVGGRHHCLEEHVARHGEQREPQPCNAHAECLRSLYSVCRQPAGDPAEGDAAHLRWRESFVPRRPRRQAAIRLGTQDDVLRHRPGGFGQDRTGGDRCAARC